MKADDDAPTNVYIRSLITRARAEGTHEKTTPWHEEDRSASTDAPRRWWKLHSVRR